MKKIFLSALAVALTLTSCEDMLAPDSDMVIYQEDHTLSSVNDTLFSVMGVIHLMQRVADRTNLLGEVRADLVQVTEAASTDLKDLAASTTSVTNQYNRPQDYYAIVNNCNYYIHNADSAYVKTGHKVFERELAVMHTFRAWAYLQLATTYGDIPFYTDFLGTQAEADAVMRQPRQSIDYICNWLIDDLRPYVDTYTLDWGTIASTHLSESFFIPVRVMLGELCLWAGRYHEAAQFYHDYLAQKDQYRPVGREQISWFPDSYPAIGLSMSYQAATIGSDYLITYIPMESNTFLGLISDLPELYTSTRDNYYYYQLTWSEALIDLSARQTYTYNYRNEHNTNDTVSMSVDSVRLTITDRKRQGDLRLYAVTNEVSVHKVEQGVQYNETEQTIDKVRSKEFVSLYRLPVIYLHFAEALNRAGFPTSAFAVLKYGLCDDNLLRPEPEGDVIPAYERAAAGSLLEFNKLYFTRQNTIGIHARGCGDVDSNPYYVLHFPDTPLATPADSIAYLQPAVEDSIITELALEACFEGDRFYDLMRVARRRNDPAYLADRVANRLGVRDEALHARLMQPQNWFLPLP